MNLKEIIRIEEGNGNSMISKKVCMKLYKEPHCVMYTIIGHEDKDFIGRTLVMPLSKFKRDYCKMEGTNSGKKLYQKRIQNKNSSI